MKKLLRCEKYNSVIKRCNYGLISKRGLVFDTFKKFAQYVDVIICRNCEFSWWQLLNRWIWPVVPVPVLQVWDQSSVWIQFLLLQVEEKLWEPPGSTLSASTHTCIQTQHTRHSGWLSAPLPVHSAVLRQSSLFWLALWWERSHNRFGGREPSLIYRSRESTL